MSDRLDIDPEIRRASTLPGAAYGDAEWFARTRERVFARTWHLVGDAGELNVAGDARPRILLEGCLDEPIVLTREDGGTLYCLSNVCTHRGNLVVEEPACLRGLRCRYHGRRFALDGRFLTMPEFDGVENFPSASDDLPRLPLERWGPFLFTSLEPAAPFATVVAPFAERLAFALGADMVLDEATSVDYEVDANWALYCDNYLEGFHIPFVHAGLAQVLDYRSYRTETFPHAVLQVGIAAEGEGRFDLPAGHPDHGQAVASYYLFLFPATMLNFYPWGVSVNIVRPLGPARTRISFLSYVADAARRGQGAGANLHEVELEDEAVVQSVQRGVRSRLYKRGRYSPSREAGVHHFHRMLAAHLS